MAICRVIGYNWGMIESVPNPRKTRSRDVLVIEVVVLAVLLCVAGVYGARSWRFYQAVRESEQLFQQADVASEHGDLKQAVVYLDQCLAVNPQYFPAYELKADIYSSMWHQPDEAMRIVKDALLKTDDPRLHKKLGELYLFTKRDYKNAQAELRIALHADPSDLACQQELRRADNGVARLPQ
jgi:tetratricopeptide (TPR) repeat protein